MAAEKFSGAIEAYTEATKINPNDIRLWVKLCKAQDKLCKAQVKALNAMRSNVAHLSESQPSTSSANPNVSELDGCQPSTSSGSDMKRKAGINLFQ